MKTLGIFSNKRYSAVAVTTGILILGYLLVNLFVIGGDNFVYQLNNNITIPLSVATTILAFSLWGLVNTGRSSRLLWGGLLAGWALWTVAEILWVLYGYLYQEIPYPSPADFFWLIGYLPMGIGLYSRSREIPAKTSIIQKTILWMISIATIVITTVFVLIPIIQSNDPSNWLESALNVIYPLTDLFLLIIITRLVFVYGGGDYKTGWDLLTAGFILHSISNLVFSYASQFELYYPDLKVNFISGAGIDAPYNISYLLWLLGIYTLRLTLGRQKPFERITQLHIVPNTSILLFLKNDDTVFETGENIHLISGKAAARGSSLAQLLNIPQKDAQAILTEIRTERKITDWPVVIMDRPGVSPEAYLSGIATLSPNGEYSGCNLVLRILIDDDYTLDEKLSKEQRAMVTYLRKLSGSSEREQIRRLLLDYYIAHLRQLYNLAFRTGGAQLGIAFMEHLKQLDREHQWQLQFHPENLIDHADYQLAMLREALPDLLGSAKHFVSRLTDPETVEAEMRSVTSQFREAVLKNVEYYS